MKIAIVANGERADGMAIRQRRPARPRPHDHDDAFQVAGQGDEATRLLTHATTPPDNAYFPIRIAKLSLDRNGAVKPQHLIICFIQVGDRCLYPCKKVVAGYD